MNGLLKVFIREHKRIKRSKFRIFILYILPLIFCFALFFIFSKGSLKDVPIGVLDLDNTKSSRQIIRMIDATPSVKVAYKVSDINEGKNLITEGKTYAFLYIPKNFFKDSQRMLRPQIAFYYNNQTMLIGGIISKDVSTAIQNSLGGANVAIKMKKGMSKKSSLMTTNVIRVDERVHANPYMNYSYFLSYMAFVHTFQIFITMISIWAFGSELRYGTAKSLLKIGDNSIINAVLGKLGYYTLAFFLMIMIILLSYTFIYGAPFVGNYLTLAVGTLLFVLAYESMGLVFVAILSNMRFAMSTAAFYTSMGFTLGGMTFPNMAMPLPIQAYSALLPIRPYIALVIDQTLRGIPSFYDLNYMIWLLAFSVFGFCFLPLLKRNYIDKTRWYEL